MTNTHSLESSIRKMRIRIAAEQRAMHAAQLQMARWRTTTPMQPSVGDTAPSAAPAAMPLRQRRWHEQAQQHFSSWLAEGGFARESQPAAAAAATSGAPGAGAAAATPAAVPATCQHASD